MGRWLMHVPVGADELLEAVLVELTGIGLDGDALGGHAGDHATGSRPRTRPESRAARSSIAGADDRRLRLEERHRTALHVRTHQRPVRVVVLKKGMSAVATDTTCLGDTSMYSIWEGRASGNVSRKRSGIGRRRKWPSSSSSAFACATTCSSSSSAGRYSMSSVTMGQIGKACAFCFFRLGDPGGVEGLARL